MTQTRLPLQLPPGEAATIYLRRLLVFLTVAILNAIVFAVILLASLIPLSGVPAPLLYPIPLVIFLTLMFIMYRKSLYLRSRLECERKLSLKKFDLESQAVVSLVWGPRPRDLDLILVVELEGRLVPVYFGNMGSLHAPPWAVLRVDVQNGFGPETIGVPRFLPGKYVCYVLNYSNEVPLRDSEAKVRLTLAEDEYRFRCPRHRAGRWWEVFLLDTVRGTVKESGKILEHPPSQIGDWARGL